MGVSSWERQGWNLPLSVQRSLVLPTPDLPSDPSLGLWSLELLYLVPSLQRFVLGDPGH